MSDHRKGMICGQNRLFTSIIIKRRRLLRFIILVFRFRPGHVANFIRLLILPVILSAQILKINVNKLEINKKYMHYELNGDYASIMSKYYNILIDKKDIHYDTGVLPTILREYVIYSFYKKLKPTGGVLKCNKQRVRRNVKTNSTTRKSPVKTKSVARKKSPTKTSSSVKN